MARLPFAVGGHRISFLIRKTEAFVDSYPSLWALRLLWLCAAIPCASLSIFGIFVAGAAVVSNAFASENIPWGWIFSFVSLGLAGLAGIVGAVIRLSNRAAELAIQNSRRRTAKVCLSAGLASATVPLVIAVESPGGYGFLLFVPFLLGITLFAATIGIQPVNSGDASAALRNYE